MLMTRQGYIKVNFCNRLREKANKDRKQFRNMKAWAVERHIPYATAFKFIHGGTLSWDNMFTIAELLRLDFKVFLLNKDSWEEINSKTVDTEGME